MTNPNASDDEAFFRARGFGLTIGFGQRPAILVVDIIKAFTDPARPLGAPLEDQIAATNALLGPAHDRKVPVIFSTVSYSDAQLRDSGIWQLKHAGSASLAASGDGPDLDPRLDHREGDAILPKKYASCFFGTDLVARLVCQRIDTLIITGCTTSGCVRASAVDALQNGFRPMVVQEAVGDRSEAAHKQSLFDLQAKYADVVTLEQTIAYLEKIPADAFGRSR